jgi:hypothetical protein
VFAVRRIYTFHKLKALFVDVTGVQLDAFGCSFRRVDPNPMGMTRTDATSLSSDAFAGMTAECVQRIAPDQFNRHSDLNSYYRGHSDGWASNKGQGIYAVCKATYVDGRVVGFIGVISFIDQTIVVPSRAGTGD